jgi:alpha-N-arabinofuranosidase
MAQDTADVFSLSKSGTYQYTNPIIPGFYPDPSVVRVNGDFYLVTSSFEYFPGIPIFHSKDLLNWRQIGHVITRASQAFLDSAKHSHGIFAPNISYHNGKFYVAVFNRTTGRNLIYTADNPTGNWSEPIIVKQSGGDPALYFEENKAYFLSASDFILCSEIDIQTGKIIQASKQLWAGTGGRFPEGPHLYKINGYYYLMIAEGGTEYGHMETIARSKAIWGPYESFQGNPILTHRDKGTHPIQGVGHADLFCDPQNNWWIVCLAYRQVAPFQQFHHLGREVFLAPVTWQNNWPVINQHEGLSLEMVTNRKMAKQNLIKNSIDHFDSTRLAFYWNTLRKPIDNFYTLNFRKGWLALTGQAENLDVIGSPSFIGRRLQHFNTSCTTEIDFIPAKNGEEAGLVVYKKDAHHYEIAVTRLSDKRYLIVRKTIGSLSAVVGKEEIPEGTVQLKVTTEPFWIHFSYSMNNLPFKYVTRGETRYLSTEVAKSYTGLYIGLYATGNGQPCTKPAFFNYFNYQVSQQ